MKVFTASFGDVIKFDKKPNEDAFLVSRKFPIFAVADGVTQSHFANGKYAYPNGARDSARIFCKSVVNYLEKNVAFAIAKEKDIFAAMSLAFDSANKKIRNLNIKNKIDKKLNYVEYDWFDTVGVAGLVLKNKVYYAYVGDCGLAIFNAKGKNIFQTRDMVRPAVKRYEKKYEKWRRLEKRDRTIIIHRDFRNSPDKKGYGSFTGEESVRKYYIFGAKPLRDTDMAVLYSDGYARLLKNKDFVGMLAKQNKKLLNVFDSNISQKNPEAYGSDRTFVAIKQ